jgi:hypothetical protein
MTHPAVALPFLWVFCWGGEGGGGERPLRGIIMDVVLPLLSGPPHLVGGHILQDEDRDIVTPR